MNTDTFIQAYWRRRWPNSEVRVERHPYQDTYVVVASFPEKDIRARDPSHVLATVKAKLEPIQKNWRRHPSRFWRKR
jgi:hypothetical protein